MKKIGLLLFITFASIAYCKAQQLPSVQLKDIQGKTVDTQTLNNDGKPFIISFFATWCKPCLRELNAIRDVYEEWQEDTDVKIIAISIDEAQNTNKVKPLVDRLNWDYEVLLDPNSEFKRALNVDVIPSVFIVDRQGNIVDSRSGYTDGSEEHLIEKVRELLNKEK
ncbi:MAG: TlpA family protein disulfide reductase [Bacteroidales bacterium]|nr:TlpA family protein disulfide reductase [Bacteroidales bacterium]